MFSFGKQPICFRQTGQEDNPLVDDIWSFAVPRTGDIVGLRTTGSGLQLFSIDRMVWEQKKAPADGFWVTAYVSLYKGDEQ